ncbi:hypothetical protein EON83_25975 [bacterium]|nr:MAG: hypothetical protein EON83_25975 [bacterium]
MQYVLSLCAVVFLLATGVRAVPKPTTRQASPPPAKSSAPSSYSLNAVSPASLGAWSFYAASASETRTKDYLPITPNSDAANTVRVVAEPNPPWRPVMEWEYGYAAGLITVRPESDRNVSIKKGDLIVMWTTPVKGRHQVRIDVDNVGNDALGGDGGTLTLSRLRVGAKDDTEVIERVAIPASGHASPHAKRIIPIETNAGDRIVMRLNAGIDGYADLWRMRYVIVRTKPAGLPRVQK